MLAISCIFIFVFYFIVDVYDGSVIIICMNACNFLHIFLCFYFIIAVYDFSVIIICMNTCNCLKMFIVIVFILLLFTLTETYANYEMSMISKHLIS